MQKSIKHLHILFLTIFFSYTSIYAQNLLTNGDFESGGSGTGFLIKNVFGYSPATIPGTSVPGNYGFTTNPQLMNPSFISGGDHTNGTGKMMVVDGNTNTTLDNFFWSTGNTGGAISGFTVGNQYTFSYWIKSVSNDVTNPATQSNIQLNIVDGLSITRPPSVLAPLPAQGWQQVSYTYTATSTALLVQMFNTNYSALGNDFAIDDVSITPVCTPQNLVITNPLAVCSPSTVNLKAPAITAGSSIPGGTLTYWTDPAASIALINPTAVASSGTYYIRSLVGICQDIKPVVVTINPPPVLVVTPPISFCNSPTVDITSPSVITSNTAGATLSYWQDAAATIPLASPNAIASNGTYYIKSTLGSCSDIKSVLVTLGSGGSIAPPTVKTPVYLCQNSVATPLTATALAGATLNWYGTNSTGGTASLVAPTPSTNTVGSTTYYVSQSSGSCESVRVPIVVKVVADTGGVLNMFCDIANTTFTNVAIDFNNVTGYIGYNYSYSIAGGPDVIGFHVSPSHFDVTVPGPGTTVTFTILSVEGLPCVESKSVTCNSKCLTFTTSDFLDIQPFCSGTTAPILANTSPNGIVGTWSPAVVSNSLSGSYVFTPDSILNPCAIGQTLKVTVTPITNAGTLSGVQNICEGLTSIFSSTTAGGTWSTSDASVATVNSATGVVTGVSAGTATITYLVTGTGGCTDDSKTREITVTAAPDGGTLSGNQSICSATTTQFSSTAVGGTWSSSNTAVATVDSATGLVNGLAAGTATITYRVTGTGGCLDATPSRTVTVTSIADAGTLSGIQNICSATTSQFSSTAIGGTWSSSNTTVATVNSTTGLVTGVEAGTATITYLVTGTGGCIDDSKTRTISVTAAPDAGTLSGNQNICSATTSQFSSSAIGGTWSSSNTTVATVDSATGLVTGVGAGTATITYRVSGTGGCLDATPTRTITVTSIADAGTLSGNQNVCEGLNIPFSSTKTGGVWSSSNTAVATVNSSTGLVTGISAGTATITYLVTGTGGCTDDFKTRDITVTAVPDAGTVSGNQNVCLGLTAQFTTTATGGIWISSNTVVATVDSASGLVTGVGAGNANITYRVSGTGGCLDDTASLTVIIYSPIEPSFSDLSLCSGGTTPNLSNISPNGITGTWFPSTINNISSGTYLFTPTSGLCATTKTINVTVYPSNTLVSIDWTVTNYFAENQVITVSASAPGNYLYQLDFGPFQSSPVFENVASGIHSITVVDQNGCSEPLTEDNILVVNYPKFFTPNEDGYNDRWNIGELNDQSVAKIYIFDRYGKLLVEILPSGLGWDGFYNKHPMPADDYWFTIDYVEQSVLKQFKSHFSLKR